MAYLQFSPVADHFAYVPVIGLIGLAAAGAERIARRQRWFYGMVALTLLVLACLSRQDAALFHDQETFWSAVLDRNPASWLAQYNMGLVRARQGRMEEAVADFRQALSLKPTFAEARNNLALALAGTGHLEESAAQFEILLQLTPDSPAAHNNYGTILTSLGRNEEAIVQFRAALRLKPDYAKARNNLSRLESGN